MVQDRRHRPGEFPALKLLLACLAVFAILLATGVARLATGRFPDPDDAMRLAQVRDLIAGQGWFDLTQYRLDPPQGTPMHWSRLVDVPLLLVIAGLTPLLGQAAAETAAFVIVPFVTFGIAAFAVAHLAWRMLGERVAIFTVIACGFLPALLFQFQPMRIDHHGWQIASVAVALSALSWRNQKKGGWAAGFAMAFGVSVSLEVLPLAGAFGFVLFLRWWLDHSQRGWLVAYMQSLAAGLILLYLAAHGLTVNPYCDAASLAHIAFFATAAVGTTLVASKMRLRGPGLIVVFLTVAIAAIGALALVSPGCLATPFGQLDPAVDRYWYRLILEGQPLWRQAPSVAVPAVVQMAAALGATAALWMQSRGWTRAWWRDYILLLLAALGLSLLVMRSLALASIIAAVPLGWLAAQMLDRIREGTTPLGRIAAALLFVVMLAPATLVTAAGYIVPRKSEPTPVIASISTAQCDIYNSASKLDALPKGTIFAPLEIGPAIILNTEHGVVATSHHRAEKAMADVIKGFMAPPHKARHYVSKQGAQYVALCRDMAEANLYAREAPEGMSAILLRGDPIDWLEPIKHGGPEELSVYRVRDQANKKSMATPLMQ